MQVGVRVHAAGDDRSVFYDAVIAVVLSWLRDGTHPLAAGPVNPGLFAKTQGRSDRHRRWMPELGPGLDRPLEEEQPGAASAVESGVRPGPRLRHYAQATAKPRKARRVSELF